MKATKIIRDVIHSDIVFDQRFMKIIDTKEFQRLNRIKQLSCEYMVFPTATHTRMAHSLGTYYVMGKLIEHFSALLLEMGYEVKNEDKDLALCAALLHDIGHGPFSHTFEKIFMMKSHEDWAVSILKSTETEINSVILKEFGEDFLIRLTEIISKAYKHQDENGIFFIISTLVSSQVDADRMDYLLRDAYFTSVTTGNYDFKRLIRAFGVEKNSKGELIIFIHQKFIATLEEYILARYYMHKEVYQHSVKRQMEGILQKIFERAKQIYTSDNEIEIASIIEKLFRNEKLSVEDYLKLDDTTLLYHVSLWQENKDEILSRLCKSFIERKKFKKYNFSQDSDIQITKFKEKINELLLENNKPPIEDYSKEYFYIEDDRDLKLYVNTKENIWIKRKDNKLLDLSEVSIIINESSISNKSECTKRIYISPEIFNLRFGLEVDLIEKLGTW